MFVLGIMLGYEIKDGIENNTKVQTDLRGRYKTKFKLGDIVINEERQRVFVVSYISIDEGGISYSGPRTLSIHDEYKLKLIKKGEE